jgi:hypothetical protein
MLQEPVVAVARGYDHRDVVVVLVELRAPGRHPEVMLAPATEFAKDCARTNASASWRVPARGAHIGQVSIGAAAPPDDAAPPVDAAPPGSGQGPDPNRVSHHDGTCRAGPG